MFLFAWGYVKIQAIAQIAEAEADFLTRHNQQAALFEAVAGRGHPVELTVWLRTESPRLVAKWLYRGARERVAVRLSAARRPAAIVKERRRTARRHAQKRGYTPSPAHLARWAWHLFLPKVPAPVWTAATGCQAYAFPWQAEVVFKSWKSALPLATRATRTQEPTLCSLSGRLLLSVLSYALCPALRVLVGTRQHRERSCLHLLRYLPALADRWLQALFASTTALCHLLAQIWVHAPRVIAKASRKRPTSAQRLRQSLETQNERIELTINWRLNPSCLCRPRPHWWRALGVSPCGGTGG